MGFNGVLIYTPFYLVVEILSRSRANLFLRVAREMGGGPKTDYAERVHLHRPSNLPKLVQPSNNFRKKKSTLTLDLMSSTIVWSVTSAAHVTILSL